MIVSVSSVRIMKVLKSSKILNNFVIYHRRGTFYHKDNLNQTFEDFFSLILYPISRAASASFLLISSFTSCLILALKLTFVNVFSSGVVKKAVVSGIIFSISAAFALKGALVARLVISNILHSSSSNFVFRASFISRLVISGILFFHRLF